MAELPFITIINPIRNVERTIDTNLKYLLGGMELDMIMEYSNKS
jgi:hypothetical protein